MLDKCWKMCICWKRPLYSTLSGWSPNILGQGCCSIRFNRVLVEDLILIRLNGTLGTVSYTHSHSGLGREIAGRSLVWHRRKQHRLDEQTGLTHPMNYRLNQYHARPCYGRHSLTMDCHFFPVHHMSSKIVRQMNCACLGHRPFSRAISASTCSFETWEKLIKTVINSPARLLRSQSTRLTVVACTLSMEICGKMHKTLIYKHL